MLREKETNCKQRARQYLAIVWLFIKEKTVETSAFGINPFQFEDSFQDDLWLNSLKSQTRFAQTSGISVAQFRLDHLENHPIN